MKYRERLCDCLLTISFIFSVSVSFAMASSDEPSNIVTIQKISFPLLSVSIILLFYSVIRLLAYRKEIEEKSRELQESENRYARITRGANDGLWDWNLETNQIFFSPRWKGMIGYDDSEIENCLDSWFLQVHPDDLGNLKNTIAAHVKDPSMQMETEYRMKHKDGKYRWMLCRGLAICDATEKAIWMAGSQTDITIRKKAEEQLIYDAFHDGLTNLANRALFIDHLKISFERKKRNKDFKFAVLFFDLDRFKNVNDSFGHLFGNRLLEEIAKRLNENRRSQDTFARFGGDEFALLLNDVTDSKYVLLVAERINEKLATPFAIDDQTVFITASIGITISDDYHSHEEMLRDADIAMYNAKLKTGSSAIMFDEAMRHDVLNVFHLETALRQAIEDKNLHIYYQPIVSLKTQEIVGFEALLRWYHPEFGFVPVTQFIPLAEETGLIVPIGNWVMRGACKQILMWQELFRSAKPLTIAVNVSAKQLYHPDFVKNLSEILHETGVDPRCLTLELTETCLMDNKRTLPVLQQIKTMNINLSIDDFGTGYSSLSYLHQYPISALKIDRTFINRMGLEGEDSAVVQTIINLAQNLSMDVIAEGVEKGEHIPILKALNCKYAQGFFFSYPLSVKDAEELLSEGKS